MRSINLLVISLHATKTSHVMIMPLIHIIHVVHALMVTQEMGSPVMVRDIVK